MRAVQATLRLLFAAGLVVATLLVGVAPAGATVTGPCEGTGQFLEEGTGHSAAESSVDVPLSDKVEWQASVNGGGDAEGEGPRREIRGEIKLQTPFGAVGLLDLGTWGPKQSTRYANHGTYDYSLPSVAGGATFTMTGKHYENGTLVCSGDIEIHIDGGGLGNPALWGSLVLTALSGAGFLIAFRV